jgi:hypothetical protein
VLRSASGVTSAMMAAFAGPHLQRVVTLFDPCDIWTMSCREPDAADFHRAPPNVTTQWSADADMQFRRWHPHHVMSTPMVPKVAAKLQ